MSVAEPDSDFHSWKIKMSEVEMEAEKIVKKFMDKCTAYKVGTPVAL